MNYDVDKSALMPAYRRLPINFVNGKGCWLTDENGEKYLDALAGIAVTALGHAHPNIIAAIKEQADKILHISNTFVIEESEQLAQELTKITGLEKVFFSNSGAEANEAAIKLARLYGHSKGISNPAILVMDKGFHGRTLSTISASSSKKIQEGYEPLVSGFIRVPFGDAAKLAEIAKQHDNIVAILLEPIPANSGVIIPPKDYLKQLRQLCDDNEWLLMLDEIQTGVGRTGRYYAHQHFGIIPDVLTSAKALANGIPIGACMAKESVGNLFQPGKHGSTFGGNPFSAHVARAVLTTFAEEHIVENAEKMGDLLQILLRSKLADVSNVKEIRGLGLLIGIELDRPCREIYNIGLKHKIIFSVTAEKVLRIVPPLIINEKETQEIAERLNAVIREFYGLL